MAKALVLVTGSFRAGGFERRLMQLLDWISDNHPDVEVHVFYQNKNGLNKPNLPNNRMHYWPSHLFKNPIMIKLENYFFQKFLRLVVRKKSINLFIGHQSILNRIAKNQFIINDKRINIIANVVNNLKYSPYKKNTFNSLKVCHSVIFNSVDNLKELAIELNLKNVYYVPNYYKTEDARLEHGNFDNKMINIVSCGSFDRQKNFKTLLIAIKILNNNFKNINFSIFGDGEQKSDLLKFVHEQNINNLFFIHDQDFKKFLWHYDIFVMTSIFEGYPNALLEAQIAGLPSVAFDIDYGPREIVKNNSSGILVEEIKAENIATAVSKLINNLEYFNSGALENSKKLLKKHSKEMSVSKLYDILRE